MQIQQIPNIHINNDDIFLFEWLEKCKHDSRIARFYCALALSLSLFTSHLVVVANIPFRWFASMHRTLSPTTSPPLPLRISSPHLDPKSKREKKSILLSIMCSDSSVFGIFSRNAHEKHISRRSVFFLPHSVSNSVCFFGFMSFHVRLWIRLHRIGMVYFMCVVGFYQISHLTPIKAQHNK